jgi:ethanolamine utilization protein EutN
MLHAKVLATVTATLKHPSLDGQRMLLVQAYGPDGATPDGEPLLAIDRHGAGAGSEVIITSDGRAMRETLGCETTPVRWLVLGICDT